MSDLEKMAFKISVAPSARSVSWKNKSYTWSELASKFTSAKVTDETYREFISAPKAEQGLIKDVGAFMGGELFGSRRMKNNVGDRCILALDIDEGERDFPEKFFAEVGCACIVHGTHKHNPKKGVYRYRAIIPLSEPIDGERYEAVARKIAERTGINLYDRTTFQPERCMFFPSVSKDVDYDVTDYTGLMPVPLDPNKYLNMYDNWQDTTEWAYHKDEQGEARSLAKTQQDPTLKQGAVGDFCRAYSISEVIAEYLSDVYEPTEVSDRWTYTGGSTSGGMLTFDDTFAYSYHNNDPIQGNHVFNAYDLVRVHKFGKMDKGGDTKKSTEAMNDLVYKDAKVKAGKARQLVETFDDFEELPAEEVHVGEDIEELKKIASEKLQELETDRNGAYLPTAKNLAIIMEYDPNMRGLVARDLFKERRVVTRTPIWRAKDSSTDFQDVDAAGIRAYIEDKYRISNMAKVDDAISLSAERNSFHPVQNYLNGLTWDGVKRVDTALIDILGADDNPYTREAFRIMLVGAVKRIFVKGCKFDSMLVLQSEQGAGKSTFLQMLGKSWFSDSLACMDGKGALEQLQGSWIFEVAELSAMRKSEVEQVKNFISKTEDTFRPAYGRTVRNFPRQCVFFGTTNRDEFLKDDTGGRRFLPVKVRANENTHRIFDKDFPQYVDQLWAEAVYMFRHGVSTLLTSETEAIAQIGREEHFETDPRQVLVEKYLEMRVPSNWSVMNASERRMYFDNYDPEDFLAVGEDYKNINGVSALDIAVDALGLEAGKVGKRESAEVASIMSQIHGWERGRYYIGKAIQVRGYVRKVNK